MGAGWKPGVEPPAFTPVAFAAAAARVREAAHIVREGAGGRIGVGFGGVWGAAAADGLALLGTLPPLYPEWLGDRTFQEAHGVRFPYVGGAMATGIASTELVIALARAGMLGFFGAAGLPLERIERGIVELGSTLGPAGLSWGSNLIHTPDEPEHEARVVDLYLRHGVRRVEAAAFMGLTLPVVRYAASGVHVDAAGRVRRSNRLFAKISRPETALRFLSPPPAEMLETLVSRGELTRAEAELAARLPVAEDITVEADSGGHTDNRPLTALLPTILGLRNRIVAERGYVRPVRVGAAGGIGTPQAVAAAFSLGAAYVVVGSIHQAAVESGQSPAVKQLLAQADVADVMMAPAGDMFEMGVKVQVLKRGSMFGPRAQRLYEVYSAYAGVDAIPAPVREKLEREIFRRSLDEVWAETIAYFERRDPRQLERANRDPKHRLALVCRWYLGQSSRWAISGDPDRRLDYQVWMGPAQGAFNAWARGTFLEAPEHRSAVQIGLNLLEGAAVVTRAQQLRAYGVAVPHEAFEFRPRPLA